MGRIFAVGAAAALLLATNGIRADILRSQDPDPTGSDVINQEFRASSGPLSTYLVDDFELVSDVSIDSITAYFTNMTGSWPGAVTQARLNVISSPILSAVNDPSLGMVVDVTATPSAEFGESAVLEVTASNLGIDLEAGRYWIGLTPLTGKSVPQEFHRNSNFGSGDDAMSRNPAGGLGNGTEWIPAASIEAKFADAAMRISGTDVFLNTYSTEGSALDLAAFDGQYDGSLESMASLSIDVEDCGKIVEIDVVVGIAHTWAGDLVMKLQAPSGALVDLVSRPGMNEPADDGSLCCGIGSDLILTETYTFDDGAAESSETMGSGDDDPILSFALHSSGFSNEFGLSSLADENAKGTWTLYVGDAEDIDTGILDGFALEMRLRFPITGDVTGDGCVGFDDILAVISVFNTTEPSGDTDCDGFVGFDDILNVVSRFGIGCP